MRIRRQALLVFVLMAFAFTAAIGQERVLQTNSGSGNIHLIDPATNKDRRRNHRRACQPWRCGIARRQAALFQ